MIRLSVSTSSVMDFEVDRNGLDNSGLANTLLAKQGCEIALPARQQWYDKFATRAERLRIEPTEAALSDKYGHG